MSPIDRHQGYSPKALQLYRRHRRGLLRLAEGIVGCPELAEDILHEAFVRFATRTDTEIDNPVRYIYTTVRHVAIDVYRKQKRQGAVVLPIRGDLDDLPSSSDSAETIAIRKQDHEIMQEVLNALPYEMRRATRLHLVEKITVREIASRLGVSVGKAHQLISDGVSECRNKFLSKTSK